ncbi:MAG: response regulator transcription factor [Thermomicrobiales bacterium]
MRILIADDHPLFRDGVASLLRARGHDIVAVAENGKEAIDLTRALQPDLVLMDLRMPEIDGLTATRIISTEMPHIKIFIITVSDEDDDLYDAIVPVPPATSSRMSHPRSSSNYSMPLSRGSQDCRRH